MSTRPGGRGLGELENVYTFPRTSAKAALGWGVAPLHPVLLAAAKLPNELPFPDAFRSY